ncbi:ABC transporter permease [Candidatus Palauibacter sp.]|uniref:ABC transporter permease n=1 Tax=Candidatus Palauibacter sp. TaxID=3101350 RepID=UPI003B528B4C
MTAATLARRGRIYVLEARYQFLMVLRDPAFAIPTLLFPLIFYLFFGVVMGAGSFSVAAPTYMLATYSVFGTLGPSLFGFGAGLAMERDSGVLLLKRTTPMPAAAYLLAKVAMAIAFGAVVVLGIFLLGAHGAGVMLYRWQWFALAGVVLAGVIPFCALGLAVGAWARGRAAVAITNLVFFPMAMLSGLWIPITVFPAALQDIANVFPAYHQAQLALKIIAMDGGQPTLLHVLVLAVQSLALLAVAAFGFRRAGTGVVSFRPGGKS